MGGLIMDNFPRVILVDSEDNSKGYVDVDKAHQGRGKHHRAFVTLLFDSNNQVLLQKRKHRLFDGLWDFTAISHPLRVNGEPETYQEASDRALKKEMGIKKVPVKKVGAFNYFARDGKYCENEYCAVLVGKYEGNHKPNKSEIYESDWVDFSNFFVDIFKEKSKYTPWAQKAIKIVKKNMKELNFLLEEI